MRQLFSRATCALVLALLAATAPALAAYPANAPNVSDFTVSDTLTATCATSNPASCAAHSVLGSATNNTGTAIVALGGTFTGASVTAEGGDCRTTWTPLLLIAPSSSSAASSTATSAGVWRVHVQGFKCFQVRVTALTSGSIAAQIHFSAAAASDPLDGNGNVKVHEQGTASVNVTNFPPVGDTTVSVNVPANTSNQVIINGVTGKITYVTNCTLIASLPASGAGTVQFMDVTATTGLSAAMAVTPQTGFSSGLVVVPSGHSFGITTASGASVQGFCTMTQR